MVFVLPIGIKDNDKKKGLEMYFTKLENVRITTGCDRRTVGVYIVL